MKSTRWMFRALCGASSFLFVGCWTPAPYGYSTYPGYYAPPNQGFVAPPGATVSPGVTYPPPQLGPPGSPGGGWTPGPSISPGPGPTPVIPGPVTPLPGAPPQPFNGGPATFSDPKIPSSTRSDNLVPEPVDPAPRVSPGPAGPPPNDQNTSPFGSDGDKSFDKGAQMQIPKRDDGGPASVAANGREPFEAPLEKGDRRDSGVVAVAARTVDRTIPDRKMDDANRRTDSRNRYDYDRSSYSYLRGVVDFNPRNKSWNIIYSANPDPKDKYGGSFQLVDNPKLNTLHDGDVVFIQGRVNLQQVDSRGKPKYEIADEVARIGYRGPRSVGN